MSNFSANFVGKQGWLPLTQYFRIFYSKRDIILPYAACWFRGLPTNTTGEKEKFTLFFFYRSLCSTLPIPLVGVNYCTITLGVTPNLHVLTGFTTMTYEGGPARAHELEHQLYRGNGMIASYSSHKTNTSQTSYNVDRLADYYIYDKSSIMDKPKGKALPPPGVPRGRRTKKKANEEQIHDDVPADTSNDDQQATKPKRQKMNIDERKQPVRKQRGIPNQSQFAASRNPSNIRSTSKRKETEDGDNQFDDKKYKLQRSFCLTPVQIAKDPALLEGVQTVNIEKGYIKPYTDWTDYNPWRLMAFGNAIEPLGPTEEVRFIKMDTLRRCRDFLTYNVRRPSDRNCVVPFERVRPRNCACQQPLQEGMKEYYPRHFAEREEGKPVQLDTFVYDEPKTPISTDVTEYFASRLQFLLACRDLIEPEPRFTDRQIYRHLRQCSFVTKRKEKWLVIFHGDITKKDARPFMTPSCIFHLLEPLGVIDDVLKGHPKGDLRTSMQKELKHHKYADLKNLNYLAGVRAHAAFFAQKKSSKLPFPGRPKGSKMSVSSIEYSPLTELKWHEKTVSGRLQIFQDDDRKEDTLDGSFCHRMDFHHRLEPTGEFVMMLHAHLLTKIQYNLVGIRDSPNMSMVFDNLLSLYGHALLFHRFQTEYNKVVGCLKAMDSEESMEESVDSEETMNSEEPKESEEPLSVIASGNLVYSHVDSVTKDHGYRHSVIVEDKIVTERDGVASAAKDQLVSKEKYKTKKKRVEKKLKVLQDSVDDYLEKLRDSTPVANFLDLYNPKSKLLDWDTKLGEQNFDYVAEKYKEKKEVKFRRTGIKYNRVKHTVIALKGKPIYHHDTDSGNYTADYCAFLIPPSLRSIVSHLHEYILHENGYEVTRMIGKGMRRINGNDNLLAYPDFESCADLFKRFSCVNPNQINDVVKDVIKAIRDGCEIAEYRKKTGFLNDENCFIRMRLQCNVPDLTKTTMECKKTAYPLTQLVEAAKKDVTVFSGILPLHNTGLIHQAYSGHMKTSKEKSGKRFEDDDAAFRSFRGLPVFIAPDTFVLYPGALPIASGMPLTPGISYFIEIDVQLSWKERSPNLLPSSHLTERSGLDCYLTSAGPAMSFFNDEETTNVKQILEQANKHPGETSFEITKDITLPSVVYWSKHGKPSELGRVLFDQIDPVMETLGRAIWFGNFEHPVKDKDKNVDRPRLGSFESVPQQPVNSQHQLILETQTPASEQLMAGDSDGSGSQTGQPLPIHEQVPLQAAAAPQPPTTD